MIYVVGASESSGGRLAPPTGKVGDIMLLCLERDPVAIAFLLFGIAAVELLTLII